MRRKLFFWLERLHITSAERKVILIMGVLLTGISVANLLIRQRQQFDQSYYSQLKKEYRTRLLMARKKDSLIRQKYYSANFLSENKEEKKTFKNSISKRSGTKSLPKKSNKGFRDTLISINKAGLKSLMSLSGIGPKTARKIINFRKKHGPFKTLKSLTDVKGIGDKKFKKIKSHIVL